MSSYTFSSESVSEGHPDKVCDFIADSILDAHIAGDPNSRVACEVLCKSGQVVLAGEITSRTNVDYEKVARDAIREIGYTDPKEAFNADGVKVIQFISKQSGDIAMGVDTGGAGDQGIMFGYACRETPELMPLPIMLAHKLTRRLSEARRKKELGYLGPDGKSQVTVEYIDGRPLRVDAVVLSTQHTEEILDKTGEKITEKSKQEILETVIKPVLGKRLMDEKTKVFINPTGKFVIGGPASDTGVTGRKIIVDTYGGYAPHGGGAFSGKDPTKVDRSAAYMARYIAKNVVAAGLAEKCTVQLGYAIGVADPVGVYFDTHGTGTAPEEKIEAAVRKLFPMTPKGIIQTLKLRRPVYRQTAAFGHFGREEQGFEWEKTDKADALREEVLGKGSKSKRALAVA